MLHLRMVVGAPADNLRRMLQACFV
jgi:hypothetical protein